MRIDFTYCEGADKGIAPPAKATDGAAGYDIRANLPAHDREYGILIRAGEVLSIPTGISLACPENILCEVRSRSGLAKSSRVVVLNAPGTIDPDFRGQISVLLANLGREDFAVTHGMRIAQIVFVRFESLELFEVHELSGTERDTHGFGSTGY